MKFILTYRNGAQEAVITDAETCEAQCNATFGLTLEQAREFGANVEFVEDVKNAFTEDEFLKADPDHELDNEKPVGEPQEQHETFEPAPLDTEETPPSDEKPVDEEPKQ